MDTVPISFECGHISCEPCAQSFAKALSRELGEDVVRFNGRACYICREDGAGDEGTPHTALIQYVEACLVRAHLSPAVLECATCLGEKYHELATHVCKGCNGKDLPLCDDHCLAHRAGKRGHAGDSLVPIAAYDGPGIESASAGGVSAGKGLCTLHEQPVYRFCATHLLPVCPECVIVDHPPVLPEHDLRPIPDGIATLRALLAQQGEAAAALIATTVGYTQVVKIAQQSLLRRFEESKVEYCSQIDTAVSSLYAHRDATIQRATDIFHKRQALIAAQRHKLELEVQELQECGLLGETVDASDPCALATVRSCVSKVVSGLSQQVFDGLVAQPVVALAFHREALSSVLGTLSGIVIGVDSGRCELSGPGLTQFIPVHESDGAVHENVIHIRLKDSDGAPLLSALPEDVTVDILADTDSGSVHPPFVGSIVQSTILEPGTISITYEVDTSSMGLCPSSILLDIRVCGERVRGSLHRCSLKFASAPVPVSVEVRAFSMTPHACLMI